MKQWLDLICTLRDPIIDQVLQNYCCGYHGNSLEHRHQQMPQKTLIHVYDFKTSDMA